MLKVTGIGIALLAVAAIGWATLAQAQQSGAGTASGSASRSGQQGQSATTQELPNPQPGAPREQAGQLLQPQPGTETRQNVVTPSNRFGQQRGYNLQGGIPDPEPTPAEMQAQQQPPAEQRMTREGQQAELGVWLEASGGPGVVIQRITSGSAAEQAGLQPGDIILEINGDNIRSPMDAQTMIRALPIGEVAVIEVWRDGAPQEISATLQPVRERHTAAYRGGESRAAGGELASRTMRLEEQLSMVMRELQQMRQELAQLRAAASSQPAGGGIGIEQPQTQPGQLDEGASELNPQPLPPDQPATQPAESAQPEQPATEPAEDLFGGETAQPEPATTPATETETETETKSETETDADSESLFE